MSAIPNAITQAAAVAAELHARRITIAFEGGGLALWSRSLPEGELALRFVDMRPGIVGALGWFVPIRSTPRGEPYAAGWQRWEAS